MRSKRVFDGAIAAFGLLITAPLWPVLALAVRLSSSGPILYRARRMGRDGEPFIMLKFRSMRDSGGSPPSGITSAGDSRITGVGRLLRSTRLDELPQLWNVLRGQMSLVGPRPEAPAYVRLDDPRQRTVLTLRPGITGPAQILFRNEARLLVAPDVDRQYQEEILPSKLEIDLEYVTNRTFLGDVRLLGRTIVCLFTKAEAHIQGVPGPPLPYDASEGVGMGSNAPPPSYLPQHTGRLTPLRRFIDRQILERLRLHGWTFTRDALIVTGAYALGMCVRFDASIPASDMRAFLPALPFVIAIYGLCTYLFGVHRRLWRYAGMMDVQAIVLASGISTAIVAAGDIAVPEHRPLPLSVVLAGGIFSLALLIAVRVGRRLVLMPARTHGAAERVLIVGAGHAGQLLVRDLGAAPGVRQMPLGFVDDDLRKQRMTIWGIPVLGTVHDLPAIAAAHSADVIGIAVPSATGEELDRFLTLAQRTEARIQILPSLAEITRGRAAMELRSVQLGDLLERQHHRDRARTNLPWLEDRVVLVTGAAGSIGAELCTQLRMLGPRRVVALDNNESGLFELEREPFPSDAAPLVPVLADITDAGRLQRVFRQYGPDIVFHAAAYKHVPMLEAHPHGAVAVNVVGTHTLCRLASQFRCERFIFISTDKAVQPQSALGYSKRIGELLVQASLNDYCGGTIFSSVRFGNVIGSRGSALPEFVRQIDSGGPVTVTHPDVERYFLTIPEAVSLVIETGALGSGESALFMLDMGEPIRIQELVHRLIRLRGLRPGKDIEIIHTGLRPGEKLSEELSFPDEQTRPTAIPGIYAITGGACPAMDALERSIAALQQIAQHGEPEEIIAALARVVAEMGSRGGNIEPVS